MQQDRSHGHGVNVTLGQSGGRHHRIVSCSIHSQGFVRSSEHLVNARWCFIGSLELGNLRLRRPEWPVLRALGLRFADVADMRHQES